MDEAAPQSKRKLDKDTTHTDSINEKKFKHQHTMDPPISTNNRYAALDNYNSDQPSKTSITRQPKPPKVPPIVTVDLNRHHISALMTRCAIEPADYTIKYMSIGIKILLSSVEHHQKVINSLTQSKVQHYTHDIPIERADKFVLKGLPEMSTDEIKGALNEADIDCLDVKKMRSHTTHNIPYLIYTKHESVQFNALKAVRSIHNVMVRWEKYANSRSGPTQCNKCQMYGHGIRNCNLNAKCMYCGDEHLKENCTNYKKPGFTPRCILCAGKHHSNDKNCPKRVEYVRMRLENTSRFQRTAPTTPRQHQLTHTLNTNNFPTISSRNRNPPRSVAAPCNTATTAASHTASVSYADHARSLSSHTIEWSGPPAQPPNTHLLSQPAATTRRST